MQRDARIGERIEDRAAGFRVFPFGAGCKRIKRQSFHCTFNIEHGFRVGIEVLDDLVWKVSHGIVDGWEEAPELGRKNRSTDIPSEGAMKPRLTKLLETLSISVVRYDVSCERTESFDAGKRVFFAVCVFHLFHHLVNLALDKRFKSENGLLGEEAA